MQDIYVPKADPVMGVCGVCCSGRVHQNTVEQCHFQWAAQSIVSLPVQAVSGLKSYPVLFLDMLTECAFNTSFQGGCPLSAVGPGCHPSRACAILRAALVTGLASTLHGKSRAILSPLFQGWAANMRSAAAVGKGLDWANQHSCQRSSPMHHSTHHLIPYVSKEVLQAQKRSGKHWQSAPYNTAKSDTMVCAGGEFPRQCPEPPAEAQRGCSQRYFAGIRRLEAAQSHRLHHKNPRN